MVGCFGVGGSGMMIMMMNTPSSSCSSSRRYKGSWSWLESPDGPSMLMLYSMLDSVLYMTLAWCLLLASFPSWIV